MTMKGRSQITPEKWDERCKNVIEHLHAEDFELLIRVHAAAAKCGGSYTVAFCKVWSEVEEREKTNTGVYHWNQWMLAQCFGIDPP